LTETDSWIVDHVTPVQETARRPRRTTPVPSVADLEAEGLIAPDDDPYRYFDFRDSRLDLATGIEGVRRAVRQNGNDLEQLIVMLRHDSRLGWKP
jgi:hypothetical protein